MRDHWRLWIKDFSTTSTSGARKRNAARLGTRKAPLLSNALAQRPTFGLSYWLFCLDSHAFVLIAVLLELLVWPLVERSLGAERLLLASPDTPYESC